MAEQTDVPTIGTTQRVQRQHQTVPGTYTLRLRGHWGAGRCGVRILDQEALDASWRMWGVTAPQITTLPPCQNCARVAGRG